MRSFSHFTGAVQSAEYSRRDRLAAFCTFCMALSHNQEKASTTSSNSKYCITEGLALRLGGALAGQRIDGGRNRQVARLCGRVPHTGSAVSKGRGRCSRLNRTDCAAASASSPRPAPSRLQLRACTLSTLQFGEQGDVEPTNKRLYAALAAEFVGMLLFALYGGEARDSAAAYGNGLALAVLVFATSNISGGHLNPAVTAGTIISGHMAWRRGLLYMAAQFLGGIIGELSKVSFRVLPDHLGSPTDNAA